MTTQEHLDFVLKVLSIFDEYDVGSDQLLYRVPGPDGELYSFNAICSDTFWWGSADCEEITPDNVDLLKQTFEECKQLGKAKRTKDGYEIYAVQYATELFAARVRKMRPQGASYLLYPCTMYTLFDNCGPPREIDFSNPKMHPNEVKEELCKSGNQNEKST